MPTVWNNVDIQNTSTIIESSIRQCCAERPNQLWEEEGQVSAGWTTVIEVRMTAEMGTARIVMFWESPVLPLSGD